MQLAHLWYTDTSLTLTGVSGSDAMRWSELAEVYKYPANDILWKSPKELYTAPRTRVNIVDGQKCEKKCDVEEEKSVDSLSDTRERLTISIRPARDCE